MFPYFYMQLPKLNCCTGYPANATLNIISFFSHSHKASLGLEFDCVKQRDFLEALLVAAEQRVSGFAGGGDDERITDTEFALECSRFHNRYCAIGDIRGDRQGGERKPGEELLHLPHFILAANALQQFHIRDG